MEGRRLWVTAVDAPAKRGLLHEFLLPATGSAKLVRTIEIGRGERFHPGGFSADRSSLWIPIAEYRRQSSAIVERRNKKTLAVESEFEVPDHIGCLAAAKGRLYGGNWDSRQIYEWDFKGRLIQKRDNSTGNSFQDIKLTGGKLVGGGFTTTGPAIDWIDPVTLKLLHRIPAGKTDRGVPFTREGLDLHGDRLYLLPEDDPSRLFLFRSPMLNFR